MFYRPTARAGGYKPPPTYTRPCIGSVKLHLKWNLLESSPQATVTSSRAVSFHTKSACCRVRGCGWIDKTFWSGANTPFGGFHCEGPAIVMQLSKMVSVELHRFPSYTSTRCSRLLTVPFHLLMWIAMKSVWWLRTRSLLHHQQSRILLIEARQFQEWRKTPEGWQRKVRFESHTLSLCLHYFNALRFWYYRQKSFSHWKEKLQPDYSEMVILLVIIF